MLPQTDTFYKETNNFSFWFNAEFTTRTQWYRISRGGQHETGEEVMEEGSGLTQPLLWILKGMVFFTICDSHTLLPQSSTNTEASRLHPSGPCSNRNEPSRKNRTSHGPFESGLKQTGYQQSAAGGSQNITAHIQSWSHDSEACDHRLICSSLHVQEWRSYRRYRAGLQEVFEGKPGSIPAMITSGTRQEAVAHQYLNREQSLSSISGIDGELDRQTGRHSGGIQTWTAGSNFTGIMSR